MHESENTLTLPILFDGSLNTAENTIAPWKKYGILFLVISETGLTPLLADSINESLDIVSQLLFEINISDDTRLIIGYSMAIPYVISAMLSIGDINKTAQFLFSKKTFSYELSKTSQYMQIFLIGMGFIIGSAAASVGVLEQFGLSWPMILFASYAFLGQMTVVLLQANRRIMESARTLKNFYDCNEKWLLLKNATQKKMLPAILNTLLNTFYWSAFYFYIASKLSELLKAPYTVEILAGIFSAFFGGYMAFCTQGLDELTSQYSKINSLDAAEKNAQFKDVTCLSFLFVLLSWVCRTFATISFCYSLFAGETETAHGFSKNLAIVATFMVVPGALSAYQYIKYIHNQVADALTAIQSVCISKKKEVTTNKWCAFFGSAHKEIFDKTEETKQCNIKI